VCDGLKGRSGDDKAVSTGGVGSRQGTDTVGTMLRRDPTLSRQGGGSLGSDGMCWGRLFDTINAT
jgi:hypothetical protein